MIFTCLKYAGRTHLWSSSLELWAFSSKSKRSCLVPLSLSGLAVDDCRCTAATGVACQVVLLGCCLLKQIPQLQPSIGKGLQVHYFDRIRRVKKTPHIEEKKRVPYYYFFVIGILYIYVQYEYISNFSMQLVNVS